MKIACIMEIHDVDDVVRLYDARYFFKEGGIVYSEWLILVGPRLNVA